MDKEPEIGKGTPVMEKEPRSWKGSPTCGQAGLELGREPSRWKATPRTGKEAVALELERGAVDKWKGSHKHMKPLDTWKGVLGRRED